MLDQFFDFFNLLETEEVRRKRKELREAREKAYEEWSRMRKEKSKELVPLGVFSPMLAKSEENYRAWIESYAKEHPEEKVSGVAVDRPNFTYRSLRIVKKE